MNIAVQVPEMLDTLVVPIFTFRYWPAVKFVGLLMNASGEVDAWSVIPDVIPVKYPSDVVVDITLADLQNSKSNVPPYGFSTRATALIKVLLAIVVRKEQVVEAARIDTLYEHKVGPPAPNSIHPSTIEGLEAEPSSFIT